MEDYERANALQWDILAPSGHRDMPPIEQNEAQEEEWTLIPIRAKKEEQNASIQTPNQNQWPAQKPSNGSVRNATNQKTGGGASKQHWPAMAANRPKGKQSVKQPTQHHAQNRTSDHTQSTQDHSDKPAFQRTPFTPPVIKWMRADIDAMTVRSNTAKRQQTDKKQPTRPPPNLAPIDDNTAAQAWRNRSDPVDHILIPSVLLSYGTHGREDEVQKIARAKNAFITCLDGGQANNLTFGIWGAEQAVIEAKGAINQWIHRGEENNRSKKPFAKVTSMNPYNKDQVIKAWKRDLKKQRYRQNPPPDVSFETRGSFDWPVEEFRPQDTLGMCLEALDPIRMEFSCYVTFVNEKRVFEVCGKHEKVLEVFKRLGGTYWQLVARQIDPERLFQLYWPEGSQIPTNVRLEPYDQPRAGFREQVDEDRVVPRADGINLLNVDIDEQNADSLLELQTIILSTLRQLHYYRGCIQMRIRLGTFVATQYMKMQEGEDMYSLTHYENMLQEETFEGHVTQELGDRNTEALALSVLQNATSLLLPADNWCEKLTDIHPEYSVVFTFADQAGDVCLTITWCRMGDADINTAGPNCFELSSKIWTRLERGSNTPVPILHAHASDLHSGMAWVFEISATQPVEENRLSEEYYIFGEGVTFDAKAAISQSTEKLFVIFRPPKGNVQLKHIQQRSVYRYTLLSPEKRATDYVLELTRFQNCEIQQSNRRVHPLPQRSGPRPNYRRSPTRTPAPQDLEKKVFYEPRWGVQMYRDAWDVEFARNVKMKIGERAEWCHRGRTWFPTEGGSDDENKHENENGCKRQDGEGQVQKEDQEVGDGIEEIDIEDENLDDARREELEVRIEEVEIAREEEEIGMGFLQLFENLERVKRTVCG